MEDVDKELREELDAEEKEIHDLVEWELSTMDYTSLQEYYVDAKIEYYHSNPEGLQDMLQYKKECTDPSIDFYWDVEKNVG
mgnify:CR=1 FL=1